MTDLETLKAALARNPKHFAVYNFVGERIDTIPVDSFSRLITQLEAYEEQLEIVCRGYEVTEHLGWNADGTIKNKQSFLVTPETEKARAILARFRERGNG